MRFRSLQLNQLPLKVRMHTHDVVKAFLRVLQRATMEDATMWWNIKNIGIDTNSGENRALLVSPGRSMRDLKVYQEAYEFVGKYGTDAPELHVCKEITAWLGVVNVFINKMGFIPIGAIFEAQLSILISEPEEGRLNGFRLEVVDARVMRSVYEGTNKDPYRSFRAYDTRFADAERKVNEGEEFIHHTPIRRIKVPFKESIEKFGMNTRVCINEKEPSWISHNQVLEPGKSRDDNILMVAPYNWWWSLDQLTGFNAVELEKIKKAGLLEIYSDSKTMQNCWDVPAFRYA